MAAAKRGRIQKKLHAATAPSIFGFISRREQSPKSIVGSLLSYIASKAVDEVESKFSGPKHRGITQKQNRFCYGLYREFVYGQETVKYIIQKKKLATMVKPVTWIIAGAALGGWYYLCTESIARFRGKQDYLNNFFAGYGMSAPFAILRRSPQMFVVAGTLWGLFFAAARSGIDVDGFKYFNRSGYIIQPQYPEAFVMFEGMMAEDEEKERKRMLAIEEWRKKNAGDAA